jgi:hypothetical protein
MNSFKVTFTAIVSTIIIVACKSTKTSVTTPAAPANVAIPKAPKPSNGIYIPGTEELEAIQLQYKDVTLQQLKNGHAIYTEGACVKCHDAKNIYFYNEIVSKNIMDDMAKRSKISDEQKDAVYKYVLAIKATQGK